MVPILSGCPTGNQFFLSRERHLRKQRFLDFETKDQPLVSRRAFAVRLAGNFAAASLVIGVSLFVGMAGYRYFENMEWIDAFANAAMILSGMGPLGELHTSGGKLFAGFFALYSGLVLIAAAGIIATPILHRILHRFHLEDRKTRHD
jgi:hypothetical protein